jgi:acyl-CoA synthetase (AMP-forming)/AMP-acid ligase II
MSRDLHMIVPALRAGATVFVPQALQPQPAVFVENVKRFRITHLFEVTANLEMVVRHLESTSQSFPQHLKQIVVGAAPVRRAFFRRLAPLLPRDSTAWCVYGMTEMLPVAAITLDEKLAFEGDGDIVGAPVDAVGIALRDEELFVSGPHLFDRYLGGAHVNEHATGDLARIDGGRIVLLGRSKDMIIRGEHNIYPALHEPVVERIPGVRRCAMIGIFDEDRADEKIVLVVEPETHREYNEREFILGVKAAITNGPNRIDDVAQPDEIVVMNIPLGGRSQKVDKVALRQMLTADMARRGTA